MRQSIVERTGVRNPRTKAPGGYDGTAFIPPAVLCYDGRSGEGWDG